MSAWKDEVSMVDGRIVVYRANLDVLVYMVGTLEQNELILATALDTYFDVLTEMMKPQLDKRSFLDNYDVAVLALDEVIDRGIILETDVGEIISKIARAPTSIMEMPLNEQTFSSALSFARDSLKSLLK